MSLLNNYSVTFLNGNWAFLFNNFQVGPVATGFNGYLTIDTDSLFHVVPMPVFDSLLTGFNISLANKVNIGNITVAVNISCMAIGYPNNLPQATYYLSGKPLVLYPNQYILYEGGDNCTFAFAGSNTVDPEKATYTLGVMAMNNSNWVFDYEANHVGYQRITGA